MIKRHPLLHGVLVYFWGQSNEWRGVFVWVDFKYQLCFSEITYCIFKHAVLISILLNQ